MKTFNGQVNASNVSVNNCLGGWNKVSMVKNTDCPFRGLRFASQHLHSGSQSFVYVQSMWHLFLASTITRHSHGIYNYIKTKHSCT